MPEYLAPGVYVEEVDTGNKPIEGVSTSTAGFVGRTVRGPSRGLPELVTSFGEFRRIFGGYLTLGTPPNALNFLPHAVEGFFSNGGKRAYVLRVLPPAGGAGSATAASTITAGGIVTRLAADAPGAAANKLTLRSLRGIDAARTLQLQMVKQGVVTTSAVLTVSAVNAATGEVTFAPALPAGTVYEARTTVVFTDVDVLGAPGTVTALATPTSPRTPSITLTAADEGAWGREVQIMAAPESAARGQFAALVAAGAPARIRLVSTAGFYVNAWVEIAKSGDAKRYFRVTAINGVVLTLDGAFGAWDPTPGAGAPPTIVSTCEFGLTVTYDDVSETHGGLTLENVPGRYVVDRLASDSTLIRSSVPGTKEPFRFPSGSLVAAGAGATLIVLDTNGVDGGNPAAADYRGGGNPGARTGIAALEDIDQISIVAAPGVTDASVQQALIDHCERLKDRFAILDPIATADLNGIQAQRLAFDTKYAAIYYPQLTIRNPQTDADVACPPSGHVAGVYARTDIERGVHKAPANEVIRGITGLDRLVNQGQQEILNPAPLNINVLRDFRSSGRGYRVWGARCITSDPDWKYVPVRRLFIYLEESIDQGTQWVVFEPNDEPLWARVRASVSAFLRTVWRDGALQGEKPEQAYFVQCDRSTMSQADIDNGKLIVRIGVAPVKPAEFVIFRIGQWTGGSSVEEE